MSKYATHGQGIPREPPVPAAPFGVSTFILIAAFALPRVADRAG